MSITGQHTNPGVKFVDALLEISLGIRQGTKNRNPT